MLCCWNRVNQKLSKLRKVHIDHRLSSTPDYGVALSQQSTIYKLANQTFYVVTGSLAAVVFFAAIRALEIANRVILQ
jgi:hypothetical protein